MKANMTANMTANMIENMKSVFGKTGLLLLLGCWSVAIAQIPAEEPPATGIEAGEPALPCIPATDAAQETTGESGQLESQPEGAEKVPDLCKEPGSQEEPGNSDPAVDGNPEEDAAGESDKEVAPADASGASDPGLSAEMEAIPDVEVSAEEEVETGDEISEDYPVPLPADI